MPLLQHRLLGEQCIPADALLGQGCVEGRFFGVSSFLVLLQQLEFLLTFGEFCRQVIEVLEMVLGCVMPQAQRF